jgi:hypothetical protein
MRKLLVSNVMSLDGFFEGSRERFSGGALVLYYRPT